MSNTTALEDLLELVQKNKVIDSRQDEVIQANNRALEFVERAINILFKKERFTHQQMYVQGETPFGLGFDRVFPNHPTNN